MKRVPLYAASLPGDLFAFLLIALPLLPFTERWVWRHGCLWFELADPGRPVRGWFSRTFYRGWGATTFGHVIMVAHGHLRWADADSASVSVVEGQDPREFKADRRLYNLALTLALAFHELTHVEQYESESIQNAVRSASVEVAAILAQEPLGWPVLLALAWWTLGGISAMLSGFLTAYLRGEEGSAYRNSHYEEAARNRVTCRNNPELMAA